MDAKASAKTPRAAKTANEDEKSAKDDEDDEIAANGSEKAADAVGKTDEPEYEDEEEADADQTGASDKLNDNNADNEDSLNLTIGEDEANIFQDEVRNHNSMHASPEQENIDNFLCFFFSRRKRMKNQKTTSLVSGLILSILHLRGGRNDSVQGYIRDLFL